MKINNPNGIRKIGEHNNNPIYYSHTQSKDNVLVGRKSGGIKFYITGSLKIKDIINQIQRYEDRET